MNQPRSGMRLARLGIPLVLALLSLLALRPIPRAQSAPSVDMGISLLGPSQLTANVIGTNVGYVVSVFSVGPSDPASTVLASFIMPVQTTFVAAFQINGTDAFTISAPAVGATGTVTFSGASLPAVTAGNYVLDVFRVIVFVPPATPTGTVITASGTVSAAQPDPNAANNSHALSAPVSPCGGGCTNTFSASTTHHTTNVPTTVNANGPDQTKTRVTALLNGTSIYDQTASGAPGSSPELALETAARAALQVAAGLQAVVSGPLQTGTITVPVTTSTTANSDQGTTFSTTTTVTIGPGTVLIGDDQVSSVFVPAGSANYNTNIHFEHTLNQITTNTTSNVTTITLQFSATTAVTSAPTPVTTATVAATPVVVAVAPTIPQVFQNPALGGIFSAPPRRPTPVGQPAAVSGQPPVVPVLRPPSTGSAGLLFAEP